MGCFSGKRSLAVRCIRMTDDDNFFLLVQIDMKWVEICRMGIIPATARFIVTGDSDDAGGGNGREVVRDVDGDMDCKEGESGGPRRKHGGGYYKW
jgi:hypothetical protein